MGLHKLEIELTDELMEAVDRLSAQRRSSPSEGVVETLRDHLPLAQTDDAEQAAIRARLAAIERAYQRSIALGINRTEEDIDKQVREFRADRIHDI